MPLELTWQQNKAEQKIDIRKAVAILQILIIFFRNIMSATPNNSPQNNRYQRVLIKISGEALMGNNKFGLDAVAIRAICDDIKEVFDLGYQVCLVVGGGNICRGATMEGTGIDRGTADHMGMLATVINGLALQDQLEKKGLRTRLQSAITMTAVAEPCIRRRAIRHMEKGRIVIYSAGTGNPFFTTDTCAALRAAEANCDLIIKGTQVDGVYSADPKKNPDAQKYEQLTYRDVIVNEYNVMDPAAISLARDSKIPIIVCNIHHKGSLAQAVQHKGVFTLIA